MPGLKFILSNVTLFLPDNLSEKSYVQPDWFIRTICSKKRYQRQFHQIVKP